MVMKIMKEIKQKRVYIAMSGDIIHHGHINIILNASRLGRLTVGVLTDQAIESYKNSPIFPYKIRKKLVSAIKGVNKVVPQQQLSYRENLLKFRPNYVVHGDDWDKEDSPQYKIREEVITLLTKWGGDLIELPYTPGVSSTELKEKFIGLTWEEYLDWKLLYNECMERTPHVEHFACITGITKEIIEGSEVYKDED